MRETYNVGGYNVSRCREGHVLLVEVIRGRDIMLVAVEKGRFYL